ncbi:MAG TPA: hypothetical protein VK826_13600, partial [Bacteroidia bacterium]|nr:hypothetical protein [Bacteroidia bacterium]
MKSFLHSALLSVCLLLISSSAFAQASACPAVNAGIDQSICSGCTNLTATIQGTNQTTSYSVGTVPYSPYPYATGTQVLINIDDTWTSSIALPFCFDFFGTTYNSFVIGSNGLISFNAAYASSGCQWAFTAANTIPTAAVPINSIMAPFHDIDPSITGANTACDVRYAVYGNSPCREMVVSWYEIPMYNSPCHSMLATQQIVLHEATNIIDMYIQNKPLCASWNGGLAIQGIQNASGTVAYAVPGRNATQWSVTNDGYRFMPTGAPNYSITWTGPSGPVGSTATVNVCPTVTSTYTATVTNNSCAGPIIVTDEVTITYNSSLTASASSTPSACTANNGTATATPSGGSGNYSYSWAPTGGTSQTATGLAPGSYTVTITDNTSGCTTTQTVTVGSSGNVTSTAAQTDLTCNASNNGSATVNISGGTGPFTYAWTPNVGSTPTVSGLAAGIYTCVVTDVNGCTTTQSFTITAPTALTSTSTQTDVLCFGDATGAATVTTSGGNPGYAFAWSPTGGTNATATGLIAGNYTVVST